MNKQIFDNKQDEVTLSTTGRVLVCTNEAEIQVYETVQPEDENSEPTQELVTKYQYDTLWVKPVKQSDEAILQAFKEARIAEIDAYDTSSSVNNFTLNGISMWLDRATRGALKNRLEAEQAVNKETSVIWYDGHSFTVPIASALQLLTDLEVYASNCYDVTAQHKIDIQNLTSIAEVGAYDITSGYPTAPEYSF